MNNNKNVLLAIALAAAVLFVWQYFVATPAMKAEQARQAALTPSGKGQARSAPARRAPRRHCPASPPAIAHMSRDAALKAGGARVAIDTPMVDGSILLKGARFDDLRLKKYRETVDPKSPEIVLLAPKSTDYPYYAEFGWVGAGASMPDDNSEWRQTGGGTLSPGHPVTLTWDNGHGLVFTRIIAIDDKYMFTVTDSVANTGRPGGDALSLWHGGAAEGVRKNEASFYAACRLCRRRQWQRAAMPNIPTSRIPARRPRPSPPPAAGSASPTNTGWRPSCRRRAKPSTAAYLGTKTPAGVDAYQANYRLDARKHRARRQRQRHPPAVRRRQGGGHSARLSGQPEASPISTMAVDWGWFWFLTRPFFWLLDNLYKLLGNFGLAILGLTVIVQAGLLPAAKRQLPLHEQDEEAAAADGGAEEAAQATIRRSCSWR